MRGMQSVTRSIQFLKFCKQFTPSDKITFVRAGFIHNMKVYRGEHILKYYKPNVIKPISVDNKLNNVGLYSCHFSVTYIA